MPRVYNPQAPELVAERDDARRDELAHTLYDEAHAGERAQKWSDLVVLPAAPIGSPGEFQPIVYVQSRYPQLWWLWISAHDPTGSASIDVRVQQGASHALASQIFGPFAIPTAGEFWTSIQLGIFFPATQLAISARVNVNSPPATPVDCFAAVAAIMRGEGGIR